MSVNGSAERGVGLTAHGLQNDVASRPESFSIMILKPLNRLMTATGTLDIDGSIYSSESMSVFVPIPQTKPVNTE